MHIKRFEADDLPTALAQVRGSLGADALVLETRRVRRGRGRFGLGARMGVEVVAAAEREQPEPAASRPPARERRERAPGPDPSWRDLRLSRALVAPLEDELRALRAAFERFEPMHAPGGLSIAEELAELRELANDLRIGRPSRETAALLAAGVAPRHAHELAREAAGSETRSPQDLLASKLEACTRLPREDDAPVLMLVGAAGVGKTTSLAKLAAATEAARPTLASTDTARLGGEAPLRALASGLRLPFECLDGPEELERLVRRRGNQPMLVDTAGQGRNDAQGGLELARLRRGLGRRGRVHLVLSATTKEADLRAEVERFRPLEPDACMVTRVDESGDLANVVNVLFDPHTPPLCWIGKGRRIPEDLEIADPAALAERVLGAVA